MSKVLGRVSKPRASASALLLTSMLVLSPFAAGEPGRPAEPPKWVALVIGNGAYPSSRLRNPANDAMAVAESLKELGFDVDLQTDLDQKAMLQKVFDFYHQKATRSTVRLIYYAGHGAQYNGHNYLMPVDANFGLETDIPRTGFLLDELRRSLDELGQGVSLIILDTCRIRLCPLGRCRGAASGLDLGAENRSSGTLIAYSTGLGKPASDGPEEDHSLYTHALLELLPIPGLSVEKLFRRLNEEVFRRSQGRQKPEFVDGLMGDELCLRSGPSGTCPAV
ncbi:caspase family protein [Methyloterricola oryzae]|uniref:caspase family protein n=1 Tax=Methyloterricola oryzae TaxID=1495050 RepID=UPI00069BDBC1|nr:caspase family protein [Methyloterricola oryzae]